ncbi:MAG: glycosyltransferase family 4 protein [Calditrichaceae bacterium]
MGASSRLRIYQYIPFLEVEKIQFDISSFFDDDYLKRLYSNQKASKFKILIYYLKRIKQIYKSKNYDLVWFDKELLPYFPAIGEWFLKMMGVHYIVDFDDAVFHNYDLHKNLLVRKMLGKKIDHVMKLASAVVVGNQYLLERAKIAGAKNINIVPTVVDIKKYKITKNKGKSKVFTIGWIGTPITARYLDIINSVLTDLYKNYVFKFSVIGLSGMVFKEEYYNVIPWSESTEVEEIQKFDVGIMPLFNTPWEQGKCGYKLIQYMACGIPVIASPIGINQSLVENGKNGFIASTEEEWLNSLKILIENKNMAREMGLYGRYLVEQKYSIQSTINYLTNILKLNTGI